MGKDRVGIIEDIVPSTASVQHAMVDVPCLVCGGAHHETLASMAEITEQTRMLQAFHHARRRRNAEADLKDRTTFSQDYSTAMVRCATCRFIYRNPRPTLRSVTSHYVQDQYGDEHLRNEFQAQEAWAEGKLKTFAQYCGFSTAVPVVVEVGSFVGGFLAVAQREGWSVLGVDPGKEVVDFCHARGLPVLQGTLDEAAIAAQSADAVVIWNTFDQLVNPDTTLGAARRVLRGKGHLVLRVPNGEMFREGLHWLKAGGWYRTWAMAALAWNNLLSFPYLNGYSVSTLDQLVARHGFTRVAFEADTLMRLSDQHTTSWGVWEEQLVKSFCRMLNSHPMLSPSFKNMVSPWLDVYYAVSHRA